MFKISMPRGDMRSVAFDVALGDTSYTDFDEIYFTVKKNTKTTEILFQKKLSDGGIVLDEGQFVFTIQPEDTNDLKYDTYACDIELVKTGAIKQTNIGQLTITEEVTFASNE